jgi:thymidylate kinase
MDKKLIIVSGLCGAGKETTGSLLSSALEPSAWIDFKSLDRVAP